MPDRIERDAERSAESGADDAISREAGGPGQAAPAQEGGADGLGGDLATLAVTSLVVAALKTELVPGVLIGGGVLLLSRVAPDAAGALQPMLRMAVKAGYGVFSAVKGALAEAAEQVEDVVAETRAERQAGGPEGDRTGTAQGGATGSQAIH